MADGVQYGKGHEDEPQDDESEQSVLGKLEQAKARLAEVTAKK